MVKKASKKVVRKVRRRVVVPDMQLVSRLDQVADALRGALGREEVYLGSESELGEPRMWVPSGVPELDHVLDREGRGWPVGRVVEIYGGEATIKTGIGYALIAQAQKLGGAGLLYPTESNVDNWLMSRYGVDLAQLVIGEATGDIEKYLTTDGKGKKKIKGCAQTVEGVFESLTAAIRAVKRAGLLIAMIDSIANLTTREELVDPTFDRDRSGQLRAQQMSKALRKIAMPVAANNVILFCINQVRDNTDSALASKPKPPGGRALKFQSSIRLRIELPMNAKIKRQRKGRTYIAGFRLRITAEKNRLADPFAWCDIVCDFEHGLFSAEDHAALLKARKL